MDDDGYDGVGGDDDDTGMLKESRVLQPCTGQVSRRCKHGDAGAS